MHVLLALILSLTVFADPVPGAQDHYRSFAELAANNIEGKDYLIVEKESPSDVLIMAFHGGLIEPGTAELAEAIAGNDFDFYALLGFKNSDRHEPSYTAADLHLTSARYDEPRLMKKTETASLCLGLHGFGGEEADFCVGGANKLERKRLVKELSERLPGLKSCELCCPPFNGTSLKNPVNKCRDGGIQVEMSPRIRRAILEDLNIKTQTADAFRKFLFPIDQAVP